MSMSCTGYKVTRRAMLGATGATILGLNVRDLLAYAGTSGKQIHRDTGISHVEWRRLRKGKVSRRATMKWAMAAGKITGDSSRRPADTYPALDKSSISAGKSKQPCRTAPAAR